MRYEGEWALRWFMVWAGFTPTIWSFGAHLEVARSEVEFRLGLGPLYLQVHRG